MKDKKKKKKKKKELYAKIQPHVQLVSTLRVDHQCYLHRELLERETMVPPCPSTLMENVPLEPIQPGLRI